MVQEQKEAASQESRSWPEVESSVFQSQKPSSPFWLGWVLGGAWGLWGLSLAILEGVQGWGFSFSWLDRMSDAQQVFLFQGAWALWSISLGGLLVHRLVEMRTQRSLAELLAAPGVLVRMQYKGEDFPTQAAMCGVVERTMAAPTQQPGGWLWAEQGRLALIGELWLLGGVSMALLGSWLQPFAPSFPLWGRAVLLAAPWIAMGAFLMLEQPSRQIAVWREGSTLLFKLVCSRDVSLIAQEGQQLSLDLAAMEEEGFVCSSTELSLSKGKESSMPWAFWWGGPALALLATFEVLRRDGAFSSGEALFRSLSTPIALGWWGFGMALMLGVLWAAKRSSSFSLPIAAWLGGSAGLVMAWMTRLSGKSIQKALAGHELLTLLLFGLGLGLLLAAVLLSVRAGMMSESPEQGDFHGVQQVMLVAVLFLGGAFVASVFWGWKAELVQRAQRLFVVFGLIGVFWTPLRFQKVEGKQAVQATTHKGLMLWAGFVAASVVAWMFLWMVWVA